MNKKTILKNKVKEACEEEEEKEDGKGGSDKAPQWIGAGMKGYENTRGVLSKDLSRQLPPTMRASSYEYDPNGRAAWKNPVYRTTEAMRHAKEKSVAKGAVQQVAKKYKGKGGYVPPMGFKSSTPERGPGLPMDIAPKPLVPNIKDAVTAAASMAQKAPTSPVSKIGIGMGKGQGLANRSSMGLRRGIGQARRAIINRIVKK